MAETKSHWALDTDWMTATLLVLFFLFCALVSVVTAWGILTGTPVKLSNPARVTWQTVLLLGACVWFGFQVRGRIERFVLVLVGLGPASHILLAIMHASIEMRAKNAEVMRVVSLVLYVGGLFYIANWFKLRIKRVEELPKAD